MSIRWSCSGQRPARKKAEPLRRSNPGLNRFLNARGPLCACLMTLMACTGCGFSSGQLLYIFGLGRPTVVDAQFHLTDRPILILLDDPDGRMAWPPAATHFVDELAQALLKNKAAEKIVPRQTLDGLRQTLPNFGKRGCREVGELAGADQVLWVRVRDFLATDQIQEISRAAHFSASVKVINVKETKRSRVRLWPESPAGHLVTVSMSGAEVAEKKTKAAIARAIAGKLARRVATLFYDHSLDDFDHEK